jgi:hypothetical protein
MVRFALLQDCATDETRARDSWQSSKSEVEYVMIFPDTQHLRKEQQKTVAAEENLTRTGACDDLTSSLKRQWQPSKGKTGRYTLNSCVTLGLSSYEQ